MARMGGSEMNNINWGDRPTDKHCWLEAIGDLHSEESGWYILNGSKWRHINHDCWFASGEGMDFTVHRKSEPVEPYKPVVGEWCEYADRDIHSKNGPVFFIGLNQDGETVYSDAYNHIFRVSKEIEFRPIKTERDILIDIILGVGGMSEGVLADAILDAGFKGPDKQLD